MTKRSMSWRRRYSLHPLHVEDCRQNAQRTKLEISEGYLFISLKQMVWNDSGELSAYDLALFVGSDFLVTVHRAPVTLLELLRNSREELRPDKVLYRVIDRVVESYIPLADRLETNIERLEDEVVNAPRPAVLANIGGGSSHVTRTTTCPERDASHCRSVAARSRPADQPGTVPLSARRRTTIWQLSWTTSPPTVAGSGALDLYMSSIANRNAEATKTLTLLGTAALPGLVIASIFGMKIEYPPGLSRIPCSRSS